MIVWSALLAGGLLAAAILAPAGARWYRIWRDPAEPVMIIYDVQDLHTPEGRLVELVRERTWPAAWSGNWENQRAPWFWMRNGKIVVVHSREVHARISGLLEELREPYKRKDGRLQF
jgi:hypothetical protein